VAKTGLGRSAIFQIEETEKPKPVLPKRRTTVLMSEDCWRLLQVMQRNRRVETGKAVQLSEIVDEAITLLAEKTGSRLT
jgi:hypothetical protein